MSLVKSIKSKTVWVGAAATILGIFETTDVTNFADMVPEKYRPLVLSLLGTVMVYLRFVTNKPISAK